MLVLIGKSTRPGIQYNYRWTFDPKRCSQESYCTKPFAHYCHKINQQRYQTTFETFHSFHPETSGKIGRKFPQNNTKPGFYKLLAFLSKMPHHTHTQTEKFLILCQSSYRRHRNLFIFFSRRIQNAVMQHVTCRHL